jgi:predicted AlkP superfamily pyrophosphatase or phosphodiesterase
LRATPPDLERLGEVGLARVTADFDGSVQSTARHAEGTAVGFNKKKKGSRSYYPLFGTTANSALSFSYRPMAGLSGIIRWEYIRDCSIYLRYTSDI